MDLLPAGGTTTGYILTPADAQGDEAEFERRILTCLLFCGCWGHASIKFCGRLSLSKEPLTFPLDWTLQAEDLELAAALRPHH